ncbi:MAG: hypothetical protein IPF84_14670 [Proteobacteria bacterium]|nr:hypothetical protein [Pseudomonadota bacterium]
MKPLSAASSIEEIAAAVSNALSVAGITAVLSGGGAVQISSSGLYPSKDLDFVSPANHREIEAALGKLGFVRESGRHYVHPNCTHTLEFPSWPLAVGRRLLREWGEYPVGDLSIKILTPTLSVMDRLAAFYHWRDRQALDQAVAWQTVMPSISRRSIVGRWRRGMKPRTRSSGEHLHGPHPSRPTENPRVDSSIPSVATTSSGYHPQIGRELGKERCGALASAAVHGAQNNQERGKAIMGMREVPDPLLGT